MISTDSGYLIQSKNSFNLFINQVLIGISNLTLSNVCIYSFKSVQYLKKKQPVLWVSFYIVHFIFHETRDKM